MPTRYPTSLFMTIVCPLACSIAACGAEPPPQEDGSSAHPALRADQGNQELVSR